LLFGSKVRGVSVKKCGGRIGVFSKSKKGGTKGGKRDREKSDDNFIAPHPYCNSNSIEKHKMKSKGEGKKMGTRRDSKRRGEEGGKGGEKKWREQGGLGRKSQHLY